MMCHYRVIPAGAFRRAHLPHHYCAILIRSNAPALQGSFFLLCGVDHRGRDEQSFPITTPRPLGLYFPKEEDL